MDLVALTALGVGGATAFGAIIGFIFKKIWKGLFLKGPSHSSSTDLY